MADGSVTRKGITTPAVQSKKAARCALHATSIVGTAAIGITLPSILSIAGWLRERTVMPANQYVEVRNGGYYIAGTRIGLDVVTYDFRNGRSPEAILDAYPSLGSLAKVYGAITFILEHPKEIEAYLEDQDRRYEEIKAQYPLTPDMIEGFERAKGERSQKV